MISFPRPFHAHVHTTFRAERGADPRTIKVSAHRIHMGESYSASYILHEPEVADLTSREQLQNRLIVVAGNLDSRIARDIEDATYTPPATRNVQPVITPIDPINPPEEEPNTMSNFNEHTIYLTTDQEDRARSGEMKRAEALSVITEGFLPVIELEPGTIVAFSDGNRYEIVRVEGDDLIVRRLVANRAGPIGGTAPDKASNYVDAIRNGRASIEVAE